jgi:hypothetical protein
MPFDPFLDAESLGKERQEAVRQTLRPITLNELTKVVKENLSDFEGDPWQENFLRMMEQHPQGGFYHAVTKEGAIVLYCRDEDAGVWVIPQTGSGPLPDEAKHHVRVALGLPASSEKSIAHPGQSVSESRKAKSPANKP